MTISIFGCIDPQVAMKRPTIGYCFLASVPKETFNITIGPLRTSRSTIGIRNVHKVPKKCCGFSRKKSRDPARAASKTRKGSFYRDDPRCFSSMTAFP